MAIIITNVPAEEGEGPRPLVVSETFDEVVDKIAPLANPSSALEHRSLCIYTDEDGNRIWCPPAYVAMVYEHDPADD